MGVLRFAAKVEPIQFVAVGFPVLAKETISSHHELRIVIAGATVEVPNNVDPETLRLVIRTLRSSS